MPLKSIVPHFRDDLISFARKAGEKAIKKKLVSSDEHSQNLDLSNFQCYPICKHIRHLNKLCSKPHRVQNIANDSNIFIYFVIYSVLGII